ncbi:MAG: hypothetical protein HYX78_06365, partial [Armatimonadetes bacterium]|nr:hypothetical protein [Armatimonadota bacterium]
TECGIWAQAGPPIGDWCRKEDGLFGLNECPQSCPNMGGVSSDWYGNIPLVYFFPDTVLSTLRGRKAYQNPNGCASNFGSLYSLSTPGKCNPMGGQFNLDGPAMVDMIDRMWMRTGNDDILREFYDCAKRVTTFTMNLRPDYGPKQVLGVHPNGDHWFQSCDFRGLSPHVGGVRMAGLRMVRRMAEKMGDSDFVQECDEWLRAGSQVLENELWNGDYYLVYLEPETDRKQDLVLGYQLEGQWMAKSHGLPDVFHPDRVEATLGTIKKCNANKNLSPHGAFLFMQRDGTKAPDGPCGFWTREGNHPPANMMLAMTYLYAGDQTFGMDLLKRTMDTLTNKEGVVWDMPCIYRADTGAMIFGNDYYQNMMLWSVPAAIEGKDLSGPCERGGLVDRVLRAAAVEQRGERR